MKFTGNIRKMSTTLVDGIANYNLPLKDVLEEGVVVAMNDLVGKAITLTFENQINCVVSGKRIKKTYGEGMSFDVWQKSPQAVESIIRPELSRIHEGIALRDFDWEQAHHNQPHFVYLSVTSDLKVGVTRSTNVPSRWIDQGASQAIIIAETPYRQLAGLMEVELKSHLADKTNWRGMLTNTSAFDGDLEAAKDQVFEWLDEEYEDFFSDNDEVTSIEYPVLQYPNKITSFKLDTQPITEGVLQGIRGQYLYFENGKVINLRSHAGYRVTLEV
ncbi:MAG: DUF2797 domain-containing protein [Cryomorphaceae bacterium]|nr:DUF2797 domain-containing protein [Cryomorphaceae bacterium]